MAGGGLHRIGHRAAAADLWRSVIDPIKWDVPYDFESPLNNRTIRLSSSPFGALKWYQDALAQGCHRAVENQPEVSDSKTATLRKCSP
jgi:hypothetical protein